MPRMESCRYVMWKHRGSEIETPDKGEGTLVIGSDDERLPELFIRGAGIYKAQLNGENPLGTMQSIEYAFRTWTRPWRRSGSVKPALKRCWGISRSRRASPSSTRRGLRSCWAARLN